MACALTAYSQMSPRRSPAPPRGGSVRAPRFWDPNRAVNPAKVPGHVDKHKTTRQDFYFNATPGTPALDGLGKQVGVLKSRKVMINKHAEKVVVGPDNKRHVTELVLGPELESGKHASARIYRSAIPRSERPPLPSTHRAHLPQGPTTAYTITGGDPQSPKLGYRKPNGDFQSYKFRDPKTKRGYTRPHREATDNSARPLDQNGRSAYVNALRSLPGQGDIANDTYKVDKAHPVTFHRFTSVHSRERGLYYPGGSKRVGHQTFVKGYVTDPRTGKKQVSWMAVDVLTPVRAQHQKRH